MAMETNNKPRLVFACFNKPVSSIESFLNDFFAKDLARQRACISSDNIKANSALIKLDSLKQMRQALINSRQFSYDAFFFTPLTYIDKTVMISNLEDGWYTLCNVISKNLSCDYYQFGLSGENESEPANLFMYVVNGSLERCVYSMKDGKWIFHSEGEPLHFEKQEAYESRLIKNRVTRQLLTDYCDHLGLFIEEEAFWESDCGLYFKKSF